MMTIYALGLLLIIFPAQVPAQSWRKENSGQKAIWIAESGPWRAVVEARYGRLRFLGPRNGPNLLHAPTPPPDLFQIGGHRVWLGPQTEWKTMWPPPKNWEMMPARRIRNNRPGSLVVESPGGKGTDVSLTRHYSWIRPGVLSCRVEWREILPAGRQAIQIFQLEKPDVIVAQPRISHLLPMGYIQLPLLNRAGVHRKFEKPPHAKNKGGNLLLKRQSTEEKLGFPVQSLIALWKGTELILHSGKVRGTITGEPDAGCHSHIYLGSDEWPVVEIEQLSPRLGPGKNSFTVEVELRNQ